MIYRAISLWQPWASLLAHGKKRIETRPKNWSYRGPIAIHASASMPSLWKRVVNGEYLVDDAKYFIEALRSLGINRHTDLPMGSVLGTNHITESWQIEPPSNPLRRRLPPGYPERAFGDYREGRWCLDMPDPQPFVKPILASGSLGLWRWQHDEPLVFAGVADSLRP